MTLICELLSYVFKHLIQHVRNGIQKILAIPLNI